MSKILEEKNEKLSPEKLNLLKLRHTTEHVLHTAMQNLYPNLKKAMGPATDDGFYFDFDLDQKISENDFEQIEKEILQKEGRTYQFIKWWINRKMYLTLTCAPDRTWTG
ncbi:MAG: Threonine-tRNA ligase [Candidatus Roizmanbacteria bacterium GW2011_GWA2_36_23]|uniref:Threonine-tRNA ligase n=1 Tax=Candidatus Roizmanbacteria bacterium GW2011_GWA2_36_23 TaxID=1618480 RepID=A0A0G0E7A1_9BACT|nr:MAG: Threonine-tRNA ligase [Candidatus Roizmanbacteria bacterium GW2011_GWA2_36_23]